MKINDEINAHVAQCPICSKYKDGRIPIGMSVSKIRQEMESCDEGTRLHEEWIRRTS